MTAYEELRAAFRWEVPASFNIGVACADVHPPRAPALVSLLADGTRRELTFGEVTAYSNRFGNALRELGVGVGDRVAVVLPQRLETAIAHLAVYKLGAIAVPLSVLFGPDALHHRLGDSGARALVTDRRSLERVAAVAGELGGIQVIVVDGEPQRPHLGFWPLVDAASDRLQAVRTDADAPALLIYTSGTTGPPKGALHAHRVVLGHAPGFRLSHDFFPRPGDRFWSPADWAWIGGLVNCLLSTWLHGRPIVGAVREGAFDPEWALALVVSERVRNSFLPPTALKLLRSAGARLEPGALRTVMSGGEVLGAELLAWASERLGVTVNEIWGQTEANYVLGNSSSVWEIRPGSMGRPYPGHEVAVLGPGGEALAPGEVGELAVRTPDPVVFLEYWRQPEETRAKVPDGWLRTGDRARLDEEGYLWFEGRVDDVISSAGYRIGPEEIEQCLLGHPAVALAAAIGVPDDTRGEVVKAFVILRDGFEPAPALAEEIRNVVRTRLAAYEYPRHLEFVTELPLTVTGKIRRGELRRREADRGGVDPAARGE
ncbi:MAG: AMP-binding protein [Actinobacteria bacterium]|nr:AMP-binding protein [Actinomycetota bacterium]